ncbi:uncharacterized protein LOC128521572 [Clarias gariepinus]|uniref:uncharacterized protein LOC128521572 n=1 Tax=Clarias gariepinus TaxID=13013 RepID=UPI00234D660D|nr:uncharacterized protein LOC128521572 [Clarias gariepinus]
MEDKRFNFSLKKHLLPKNKNNHLRDPTNDFSIIPSWNKEFVCLLGLEEVVQFRLEWQDKIVSTVPNKHRTRGRKKRFPIPSVVPATLPKDPYTCVKCSTDVSCSWNRDGNCSVLCHTCFKCSWRKDHRLSSGPKETTDKSPILTSFSQVVSNEPQVIKEDVLPLLNPSHSTPEQSDPLTSSPSTHLSILSQSALSTNQEKTKPEEKLKWNAAPNQKIDKWIKKPKPSMGTHGSYASHLSSSFGQSRNVNRQVVVSPKREICSTKFRSTHK